MRFFGRSSLAVVGLLMMFGAAGLHGGGKTPSPAPTSFECRFTDTPIKIDGKGSDPAWKNAQVIDHFYLPWDASQRAAKTKTKAKLLWDREFLYFLADMEDSDLYADEKNHDGMLWFYDVFELFFKPADDKPGYYEFQVNPANAVLDMFLPRRNAGGYQRFIKDGDFHIETKVHLRGTLNNWTDRDEGWSVEGKIPWTDFLRTGGRPNVGEAWKFALCRYDYSVAFEGPELSTCAPLKTSKAPNFHAFEDYATLKFVGPKAAKQGAIEKRVMLATSKVVGSPEPPPPYRVKKVLDYDFPVAVEPIPGSDHLLILSLDRAYDSTKIHVLKDGADPKDKKHWLTHTDTAYAIAYHPKFADNGFVYVGSNGAPKGSKEKKKTRIVRYTMRTQAPYDIIPGSEKTIIDWVSDGHNGGAIGFGLDGMLYVTTGDGTSDSDTNVVGQDMTTLLAKVLRIDVDRPDPGKMYSIPKDNPFLTMKDARPEIWAVGMRNPWKLTVDAKTGHVWVGNNGQDLWEQAYLVKKGDNFGWSVTEGSHPFYEKRKLAPVPLTKPTVEHHHSEARSLTGGIVYYGKKHAELVGAYIYGDYSTGKIWAVKHDGDKILWHKEIADSRLTITGFGVDTKGEILIADFQGKDKGGLFTLVPTPKETAVSTFPRKLSESGLFRSVKGHVMEPSLIPYSVNSVLWSDGAGKQRWLGVPGDETIDFSTSRGWNFPDKTVIVKSFYLDLEEGNPQSRRWIETRFLTRQDGEWHGYSYQWNDAQDEGVLLDAKGIDQEYTIKVPKSKEHPDGVKKQLWHYPSRAECMVCHSRAANWVLGLSEVQMNKDHDYGNCVENQLTVLERLGMLKVNYSEETRKRLRDDLKAKGKTDAQIDAWMKQQTASRDQREAKPSSLLSAPPVQLKRLVDPSDKSQPLELRARSYLHSNCASCHVEAGGGNALMELEFAATLDKMRIVGVRPQHDTYGLKDAALVVPGHPERSVLLHRITHRDKGHMPPLATRHVDHEAVELMRAWIAGMKK
jgi:glucose/arabinose dehydrogenase